jgi:ribose 5-phosphate isomerase RpiB
MAKEIVAAFLAARYWGLDPGQERHARRVAKIRKLEDNWVPASAAKLK